MKKVFQYALSAILVVLLFQVGFALDPSAASAKVRTHNYQQAPSIDKHASVPHQPVTTSKSFTDKSTGIEMTIHYPDPNSSMNYPTGDKEVPLEAKLTVLEGEAALHESGECTACDKLRELYSDGKAIGLYYVSLKNNYADRSGVSYSISVPSDSASKLKIYLCDKGSLDSSTPTAKDGRISFPAGKSAIFAVVDESKASASSKSAETKRKNVVVYDDDDDEPAPVAEDDDGDDERDPMLDVLSGMFIIVALLTTMIALMCLCIKDMRRAFFSRLKTSIHGMLGTPKDTIQWCACIVFWCAIVVFTCSPLYQIFTHMSIAIIWAFIVLPYFVGMVIDALLLAGCLVSWSPNCQSEE